jgi:hypothetical protein
VYAVSSSSIQLGMDCLESTVELMCGWVVTERVGLRAFLLDPRRRYATWCEGRASRQSSQVLVFLLDSSNMSLPMKLSAL